MITRKHLLSEKNCSSAPKSPQTDALGTQNSVTINDNSWQFELANALSDPLDLLTYLAIDPTPWQAGFGARKLFAQRVPLNFVERMKKGDPSDPLLRQVLPIEAEFEQVSGYSSNPLEEAPKQAGLLHKYKNRVLLIVKGGCAINCRYCFRRHFPYQDNQGNKTIWQTHLDYIEQYTDVEEVILSGGDPLMAKDHELAWLIESIDHIKHVKTLRIHSRLPVVIPSRITDELCQILEQSRLTVVLVTHINHANEIHEELALALNKLKKIGVHLLNQSVLLKGVNDSSEALADLSRALFEAGVLPYYLHLLDKVQGAAHFYVSDEDARQLMRELLTQVSGYLVPTLARENAGEASKTPLDLFII